MVKSSDVSHGVPDAPPWGGGLGSDINAVCVGKLRGSKSGSPSDATCASVDASVDSC